jgi:bacterial/archaeal transporter family-2 protein
VGDAVNFPIILATLGAGFGLAAGLAFNLRLSKALGTPLGSTLANFWIGAITLLSLWLLGVAGTRPSELPPLWMMLGGMVGATYVTLSLVSALRLGVGLGTIAATFGQVLSAQVITGLGWLGQSAKPPNVLSVASAVVLLAAVALLARDREQAAK